MGAAGGCRAWLERFLTVAEVDESFSIQTPDRVFLGRSTPFLSALLQYRKSPGLKRGVWQCM